MALFLYWKVVW